MPEEDGYLGEESGWSLEQSRAEVARRRQISDRKIRFLRQFGVMDGGGDRLKLDLKNAITQMAEDGASDAEIAAMAAAAQAAPGYGTTPIGGGGDRGTVAGTFGLTPSSPVVAPAATAALPPKFSGSVQMGSAPTVSNAPSAGPNIGMTFPGYNDQNDQVEGQYAEWRDARSAAGQDPYDMGAFREHLIGIGAPDPGEPVDVSPETPPSNGAPPSGNPTGTASVDNGIAYDIRGNPLGPAGPSQGQLPSGEVVTNSVTAPVTIGGITYRPPRPGEQESRSSINDPTGDWVGSPGQTGPGANPNAPINPNVGAPAVAPGGVVKQDIYNPTLPGGPQGPAPRDTFKGGDAAQGPVVTPGAPGAAPPGATFAARAPRKPGYAIPRIGEAYDPMQQFLGLAAAGGRTYPDRSAAGGKFSGRLLYDPETDPDGIPPKPTAPVARDPFAGIETPRGQQRSMKWDPNMLGPNGGLGAWVPTFISDPNYIDPNEQARLDRMNRGGQPTIINTGVGQDYYRSRTEYTDAKTQAELEKLAVDSAGAKARKEDAEAKLAEARASRIPQDIAAAEAEVAEKTRQFDITIQNQQAARAQQNAQFQAGQDDAARQRAQQQGQFDTSSSGYDAGGDPTLDRETQAAIQERANLDSLANRARQAAEIALRRGDQVEAQRQFDLVDELNNKKFGLDQEIQRGTLDVSRGGLNLQREKFSYERAQNPFTWVERAQKLRGETPDAPEVTEPETEGGFEAPQPDGGDEMMRYRGASGFLPPIGPTPQPGETYLDPWGRPTNNQGTITAPRVPGQQGSGNFPSRLGGGGGPLGIEQPTGLRENPDGGIRRIQPMGMPGGRESNPMMDLFKNSRMVSEPGRTDFTLTPQVSQPRAKARRSLFEYAPGAVGSTFRGEKMAGARFAAPVVSAQSYNKWAPSERAALDVGLRSQGTDPADYHEERQRLSATGATPRVTTRTIQRRY